MSIKTVALAATAILVAAPAFAATRHKSDPILNHNGPVTYAELQQMDSGQGYNSRTSRKHAQTHVAAAASPDAAAPSPTDTTSAPSVANPADAVNAPAPAATTTPAAPPTSTGQLNTAPGDAAGPTPIPSTPSSPTPPSTPQ